MGAKIGFEFPVDPADEWDGFNYPGIEHFSGMPYAALGREVPQNVVDALAKAPAKIAIRLIEVPVTSIPDVEELRDVLRKCAKAAVDESTKAEVFFKRALEVLAGKKVKILQIAD